MVTQNVRRDAAGTINHQATVSARNNDSDRSDNSAVQTSNSP